MQPFSPFWEPWPFRCPGPHGFPGSLGHEYDDALQFAQCHVDYLKYDDCNQPADQQNIPATIARYQTMSDALAAATAQTGQSIVFSICEKTDVGVPNSAWPEIGNLWRTTGDIHDLYSSMLSNFKKNVLLANLAKPDAWNDADMNTLGVINISLHLTAGANTIEFANTSANAPDIDRILVAEQSS